MTAVTTNTNVEEYNPFADQPPPPPEVSVLIMLNVSVCIVALNDKYRKYVLQPVHQLGKTVFTKADLYGAVYPLPWVNRSSFKL